MTTLYAILTTRAGEAGTTMILEVDADHAPLPQALEHLYALADTAAQRADDLGLNSAHDLYAVRDEIEADRERASHLDESGVRYTLPDGTRLEAVQLERELLDACARGFVRTLLWSDAQPMGKTCGDCGNVIDDDSRGHDEDCASIGQPGTFDREIGGLENSEPTAELREIAWQHCARFLATAQADDITAHMEAYGDPDGGHPGEYVGHTFYLNASGHGVSFTDRAWRDDDPMTAVCKRLRDVADTMREVEHISAYELADGTVGT